MKRFMIVDDEPAIGRLIARVAAASGYSVSSTTDPETFMDEVVWQEPHVIALDLSMPGVDGVELLRFLAAIKCKAKILVISGFDPRVLETSGTLGSALGLRICGTLSKPMRVADLREAIAALDTGGIQ